MLDTSAICLNAKSFQRGFLFLHRGCSLYSPYAKDLVSSKSSKSGLNTRDVPSFKHGRLGYNGTCPRRRMSFLFHDLHLLESLLFASALRSMKASALPNMTAFRGKTIRSLVYLKGKVELLLFLLSVLHCLLFFPNLQLVALGAQAYVAKVFDKVFTAHFADILFFGLLRSAFSACTDFKILAY